MRLSHHHHRKTSGSPSAVFHVRDNGFGITKEDLHTLRQSFTEKSLDHIERIGLKNIYQRAQLLYGPESI